MTADSELDAMRKRLRARSRDGGDVTIGSSDLRLLLDELGRLQQSNDRLRRQNRRVRLKLQRAGLDEPVDGAEPDDSDAPPVG